MPYYKLHTQPGNEWLDLIAKEYERYKKEVKPRAQCVTFLVFSGISYAGFKSKSCYFPEEMCDAYSNAFQIHQRPVKTAVTHKKWIRKLPYVWYLFLVAAPVDVYAHTYQFICGETDVFLEGGGYFIPYQVAHWTLLSVAFFAGPVHDFVPQQYWYLYFKLLRFQFCIHEYVYCLTLRKLTLFARVMEFSTFLMIAYFIVKLGIMMIELILN
jgi:hypothetical protein